MTFEEYLASVCRYREVRIAGDRRQYFAIAPFMFTHAIIKGRFGDLNSFDDRWCYHTFEAAKAALDAWDGEGEPEGWHRHPASGRRRGDDPPPWAKGQTEWIAP